MILENHLLLRSKKPICVCTYVYGKEEHPPLHISVVAIEKGAFRLPLTAFTNFTTLLVYLHKSISKSIRKILLY